MPISDKFSYEISGSNATIIGYTDCPDSAGDVIIPATINDGTNTYNVTSIGNYVFESCSSLTSVIIPNSVVSIGNYTFLDCTSLTSVIIPNSVTSIGNYTFFNCRSLTSVIISNSVTSIGNRVFANCISLTSMSIPNSVTSIGDRMFQYCISLTSVTIPDSITSIGNDMFGSCSRLISVIIPNSVTSIGNGVFTYCSSLTSVIIPNSVASIGNHTFFDCTSLTSVIIPDRVTRIGNYMFYNCSSLTSVSIPNGVTSIGNSVFANCTSLTSMSIPNSVTSIGDSMFGSCRSLTSVIIPDSVTSIGNYTFYSCRSLTSVTIPDSVTNIGNYTFYNCSSLKSVTIPDSITSIGDYAFGYCNSLLSIDVESGNSYYTSTEGVLYNNSKTILICCPAGKTGSFTILNNVKSIENGAFAYCSSLTNVTIPNSVISIGNVTFYNCTDLVAAYFFGNAPTMGVDVFYSNASNFKIYYLYETTGFATPTWQPPNTFNSYNTEPFYMVTYDDNGSTSGTAPVDKNMYLQGKIVIVLSNVGALVKRGYTFVEWNTESDGTGTSYAPGEAFTTGNTNTTLYANWQVQQGPLLISSTLTGTLLTYNDGDISNIESMIIKEGYHSIVTIPLTAELGNTFTISRLTLNTSSLSNHYIKFDFTSNIVTGAEIKISFQVCKLYQNILIPVGSIWIFLGSGEVGTVFSFSAYDYNSHYDENPVYAVVATIL